MKKIFLTIGALLPLSVQAYLPASAVTEFKMEIYGIYTSNDPTCQNNLKATVPLQSSPREINFASAADLGVGKVPKSIRCVVIVAKNLINVSIASGNYTTTTNGYSDNVCNAGKTVQTGIYSGLSTVEWPVKIQQDMAALGLSTVTTIPNPDGSEILPVYLSTYSKCAMDMFSDQNTPGCWANNNSTTNHMVPPTVENDTTAGIKLIEPENKSSFKFFTDVTKFVGADDYDNNPATPQGCGTGVPLWGFR